MQSLRGPSQEGSLCFVWRVRRLSLPKAAQRYLSYNHSDQLGCASSGFLRTFVSLKTIGYVP